MELTATNVYDTGLACMYRDGEDHSHGLEVRAVKLWIKFDPARVAEQHANILDLLSQLPHQFRATHIARGASFLLACEREDGVLWGEHTHVDTLVALGLAVEAVHFTVPRELWGKLTMGVPNLVVKLPADHIEITAMLDPDPTAPFQQE